MMHFNGVVTLAIDDGMNGKFFHFKFEINFGATYSKYFFLSISYIRYLIIFIYKFSFWVIMFSRVLSMSLWSQFESSRTMFFTDQWLQTVTE
jgi:hypothetical protein